MFVKKLIAVWKTFWYLLYVPFIWVYGLVKFYKRYGRRIDSMPKEYVTRLCNRYGQYITYVLYLKD